MILQEATFSCVPTQIHNTLSDILFFSGSIYFSILIIQGLPQVLTLKFNLASVSLITIMSSGLSDTMEYALEDD